MAFIHTLKAVINVALSAEVLAAVKLLARLARLAFAAAVKLFQVLKVASI